MRYNVTKTTEISVAHQLSHLPPENPCSRLHGHNLVISITISSERLDNDGMVVDFGLIAAWIRRCDHRNLNEFFQPATSEMFCQWLWDELEREVLMRLNHGADPKGKVRIEAIEVCETAGNKAVLSR